MEKYKVSIDKEIKELIPAYMQRRREDIKSIERMVGQQDFEGLRRLGHNLKGSGGNYGFYEISKIGAALNAASKNKDSDAVLKEKEKLRIYVDNLEIEFI